MPKSDSKTKRSIKSSNLDLIVLLHDIRTHLSPIKTYSEMLASQISGPLNEKQEKMILSIQRCVDRLENLVSDVSYTSQLESESLTPSLVTISVQDLVDYSIPLLRKFLSEKQIELKVEVDVNEKIHVDKDKILQVFVNLVKNIVDYVYKNDDKITIKVQKDGLNVLFTVEDDDGLGAVFQFTMSV